jgi:hypothetical protein
MKKQILINLFGAAGKRTIEVTTRGGFYTRHVKAPREAVPSTSAPVKPKPQQTPATEQKTEDAPPTLLEVLKWMEASEHHSGWLIIDEILFVATANYKMKFNHNALLDALRYLYTEGVLEYRLNRFNQHTFRLIEKQQASPSLKDILAEVDVIVKAPTA